MYKLIFYLILFLIFIFYFVLELVLVIYNGFYVATDENVPISYIKMLTFFGICYLLFAEMERISNFDDLDYYDFNSLHQQNDEIEGYQLYEDEYNLSVAKCEVSTDIENDIKWEGYEEYWKQKFNNLKKDLLFFQTRLKYICIKCYRILKRCLYLVYFDYVYCSLIYIYCFIIRKLRSFSKLKKNFKLKFKSKFNKFKSKFK